MISREMFDVSHSGVGFKFMVYASGSLFLWLKIVGVLGWVFKYLCFKYKVYFKNFNSILDADLVGTLVI